MKILVTGVGGFIGFSTAQKLLKRGHTVIGIDNLNDYYSVDLKKARLEVLKQQDTFTFHNIDIADTTEIEKFHDRDDIHLIIHLAAQAGVRFSIISPETYVKSNLVGYFNILELARNLPNLTRMVYASSSSVYGKTHQTPYSEKYNVNAPASFYAATKVANEAMGYSYADLYGIEQVGLRFFTVYGPWGRPDMAYWIFTDKILNGETINVFNNGDMSRDYTFIDDIVAGILLTALAPKTENTTGTPHKVYNIGNGRPVNLLRMIEILETELGKTANKNFMPMQDGDVYETCADISAIQADYGYKPTTPLEVGIPKFIDWYRAFYKI